MAKELEQQDRNGHSITLKLGVSLFVIAFLLVGVVGEGAACSPHSKEDEEPEYDSDSDSISWFGFSSFCSATLRTSNPSSSLNWGGTPN